MSRGRRDFTPADGADERKELKERMQSLRLTVRAIEGRWVISEDRKRLAVDEAMRLLETGDDRTKRAALDLLIRMEAINSKEQMDMLKLAMAEQAVAVAGETDVPSHLAEAVKKLMESSNAS